MQIMSDSVSKALRLLGGTATEETAKFVEMFDKFFDALNVSNFTNGKQNRNHSSLHTDRAAVIA